LELAIRLVPPTHCLCWLYVLRVDWEWVTSFGKIIGWGSGAGRCVWSRPRTGGPQSGTTTSGVGMFFSFLYVLLEEGVEQVAECGTV